MADITSANAVLLLSVPLLLPVAQQIQGFAVDDAFDFDQVDQSERQMGVDGRLSAGFVYVAKPMTITLQADSESNDFFDAWVSGQAAGVGTSPADGILTLTSVRKSYSLLVGFLGPYAPAPSGKRVLQPRKYQIFWQSVIAVPIGIAG